jgi:hypothetical protein
MKKPRPKKPKQRKSPPPTQQLRQPQQTATRKSVRLVWAIVVATSVVVGLPGSVFALWPRVTVTPSGQFDEANAYSETFTATNVSFIPLRDFNIAIGFCNIETAQHDLAFINNCTNEANIPRMLVGDPSWHAQSLSRDEPFSITLSDQLTMPTDKYRGVHPHTIASWKTISELKGANAVVVLTYQPWVVPCWPWVSEWVCVKRFRFTAEEQPNGKVMWRAVPRDWKPIKVDG